MAWTRIGEEVVVESDESPARATVTVGEDSTVGELLLMHDVEDAVEVFTETVPLPLSLSLRRVDNVLGMLKVRRRGLAGADAPRLSTSVMIGLYIWYSTLMPGVPNLRLPALGTAQLMLLGTH